MRLQHFEVREEVFRSESLLGNPAGDPAERVLPVVLPAGAAAGSGKRFPVIFVLAGYTSSARSFLNWHAWTPTFPERLDRLRATGAIGDLIAVFPDAFTIYGGSQYINSTATGRYEDMLVRDLVAWVDTTFPTIADPRHRAILGKSSGGYGAIVLGMRHPDVFSAVACHSGDMYFEYCYRSDFPRLLRQLRKRGGLEGFMKFFLEAPKRTGDLVLAMDIVAMAAAYSPNPAKPWRVDLPFDPETGEILDAVWKRWLEHDPVQLASTYADNLRKLRLLYLDCGSEDQFHLQYGLRILCSRLRALGIEHFAEEYEDDHTDVSYRYERSLPMVWDCIRAD